jgi:polyisoprenoid-binding protein YceI
MYITAHYGFVKPIDGFLIIENSKVIGSNFTVDMNSITCVTITEEEQIKSFLDFIKSSEFFWIKRFPISKLTITKVTEKQSASNNKLLLQIKASMEIRGITREVNFPAELNFIDDSIMVNAKVNVDRTLFGIKFGSEKLGNDYGDYTIDDIFTLDVNFLLFKQPTQKGE